MSSAKFEEDAEILENAPFGKAGYHRLRMRGPRIAAGAQPGQFVHVRAPGLAHRVLRRPFSICDVDVAEGVLTIVYKVVGEGTQALSAAAPGTSVSVLGPLGRGFTVPRPGMLPVLVGGGYGAAALFLLARACPTPPKVLIGGRRAVDLLLISEFESLGAEVEVTTEDGSAGRRGLVTEALAEMLAAASPARTAVFACGPNPMLRAVADLVSARGMHAELSLDERMGCGVGACFACVVKLRADNPDGWEYVRSCVEGPVFPADRLLWE